MIEMRGNKAAMGKNEAVMGSDNELIKEKKKMTEKWKVCFRAWQYLNNEKGELVGSIGWMALLATALVLAHGLITGWLPDFMGRIFARLETLVFIGNFFWG